VTLDGSDQLPFRLASRACGGHSVTGPVRPSQPRHTDAVCPAVRIHARPAFVRTRRLQGVRMTMRVRSPGGSAPHDAGVERAGSAVGAGRSVIVPTGSFRSGRPRGQPLQETTPPACRLAQTSAITPRAMGGPGGAPCASARRLPPTRVPTPAAARRSSAWSCASSPDTTPGGFDGDAPDSRGRCDLVTSSCFSPAR
jgi:hypothetical protein